MTRILVSATLSLLTFAAVSTPITGAPRRAGVRYWNIDPNYFQGTARPESFPEYDTLAARRRYDVGVAFSGGGTRSAAATIGQLRGLVQNRWLERVRYVTAVSGGSWAAVPFIYSRLPAAELLGEYQTPGSLTGAALTQPHGLLASTIVRSGLAASGFVEAARFEGERRLNGPVVELMGLVGQRRAGKGMAGADKTFARILGDIFLKDPLRGTAAGRYFTWDDATFNQINARTGFATSDFLRYRENRPFLILGASMIFDQPIFEHPRVVPVEYTPLYSGIRQQFGRRVGGTYIWSWAYGTTVVGPVDNEHVEVDLGVQRFTLADAIAISGAAPQLALFVGRGPERIRAVLRQAAGVFPSLRHFTVHDGIPAGMADVLPHGDGGFTDNLGIMPLLARRVRNIIVFVNSSSEYDVNSQLQSYFQRVASGPGEEDREHNEVFRRERYDRLMEEFGKRVPHKAMVYCGEGWDVRANETYNIAAYQGLNICWVYNHLAEDWRGKVPDAIRSDLFPPKDQRAKSRNAKRFEHFPFFATFGENKPFVIKLHPSQVNLLSNLSAWSITNRESADLIVKAFKGALLAPPPDRSPQ